MEEKAKSSLQEKEEFYLVLHPTGKFEWICVPDRSKMREAFGRVIGTEWLEHVTLPFGFDCIVDECGKIKPHPQLVNVLASRFYPGTPYGDPLVGPVIFVRIGLVEGEFDWCPITARDITIIETITGRIANDDLEVFE